MLTCTFLVGHSVSVLEGCIYDCITIVSEIVFTIVSLDTAKKKLIAALFYKKRVTPRPGLAIWLRSARDNDVISFDLIRSRSISFDLV